MKKLFLLVVFTIFFVNIGAQEFPTYFQYTPSELKEFCEKNSSEKISNEDLRKWDQVAAGLIKENPNAEASRMYAYLYTAQKEAAFLSHNCHNQFVGNLGPISVKILKLFFSSVQSVESDEYSESLANVVYAKLKKRFDEETPKIKEFPIAENDPKLKEFPKPCVGLKYASCYPWILKNPRQYMAPQPPAQNDSYWMEQSEIVKNQAENASEQQIQAIMFWAGKAGPNSGDWKAIANDYMFDQNTPLDKVLYVRSILAEGEIDANIALFNAKYTYLIKRPSVVNPSIKTHIPFPKHPSYPSGHSTWSPFCAVILSYYFPEEKDRWFQMAEEAGHSRIWAGIHYPIDHQNGWNLGMQLGNEVLHSPNLLTYNFFQKN